MCSCLSENATWTCSMHLLFLTDDTAEVSNAFSASTVIAVGVGWQVTRCIRVGRTNMNSARELWTRTISCSVQLSCFQPLAGLYSQLSSLCNDLAAVRLNSTLSAGSGLLYCGFVHRFSRSRRKLSELLGRGNLTRRTTTFLGMLCPISTSEVLMGIFWLTSKNVVWENWKE